MSRLGDYAQLMRLNRPIGILLLLWPVLWALWIAGAGQPSLPVLLVRSHAPPVRCAAGGMPRPRTSHSALTRQPTAGIKSHCGTLANWRTAEARPCGRGQVALNQPPP